MNRNLIASSAFTKTSATKPGKPAFSDQRVYTCTEFAPPGR